MSYLKQFLPCAYTDIQSFHVDIYTKGFILHSLQQLADMFSAILIVFSLQVLLSGGKFLAIDTVNNQQSTILAHILQEMVQDFARVAARIITCISCTFFARSCKNWCKIMQESCKKRDISRARAKQVLHARFLQDSCMILQFRFCWVEKKLVYYFLPTTKLII